MTEKKEVYLVVFDHKSGCDCPLDHVIAYSHEKDAIHAAETITEGHAAVFMASQIQEVWGE